MLFQALDNKNECIGVYANGELIYELPENLTKTWGYSSFLSEREIEYASLYCMGKDISEVCPEGLREEWALSSERMRAYLKSFTIAKISLDDNCFFDLIPKRHLMELCEVKNKIAEHVFQTYERPRNYEHLLAVTKLVEDIAQQPLKVNSANIKHLRASLQARNFLKKIQRSSSYCKYVVDGTKTGRLTVRPNSFPILTMNKDFRSVLEPQNDWFVELDYNAAELRVLLALLEKEQPKGDIHKWNLENVFKGMNTRSGAKKRAFAWLYNPNSEDTLMDHFYERNVVVDKFWDGSNVNTCFGRTIPADSFHALNYIVQSTCADMVLEQACKIHRLLAHKRSSIAFVVHDSIVLDFADEDRQTLAELVSEYSTTRLGQFMVNLNAGKNFGNLKPLRT